jgi:CubicO group peptidase (beta-lactamase class C family)
MTSVVDAGFSTDRLDAIQDFLQAEYIDSGRLPCAQLTIARSGQSIHRISLGQMDVDQGLPLPENAIFRIYSMTKPVTSVAAMMLVEKGLLSLHDPVAHYIPSWSDLKIMGRSLSSAPKRPMIVADLFRHTSGLTYSFQQHSPVSEEYRKQRIGDVYGTLDLADTVEALATIPLDYAPGDAWNYSLSVDVLGHIVELVSGLSLDAYFKQHIFDPLGMHDTGFQVRDDQLDRLVTCYKLDPAGALVPDDVAATSPYRRTPSMLSGGGGLVSTSTDYMQFVNMLAGGGEHDGVRLLAPATIALMGMNHLPGNKDIGDLSRSSFSESVYPGMGFGLGFAVITDPVRTGMICSRGEMHWGGMASTTFWVDPAEQLGVVFMSQLVPSTAYPIRRQLRNLVYASLTQLYGRQ